MKKYDSYKDSGVKWIGEIPTNWHVLPIKYLSEIGKELEDPSQNEDTIYHEYSMPAFDMGGTPIPVKGKELESTKIRITKPTLLINKLNVFKQRIWMVNDPKENAVASTEFIPIHITQAYPEFVKYYMLNKNLTDYLVNMSNGSTNSQRRVSPDTIYQLSVCIPSHSEQEAIAAYLDEKTSKIDALIEAKEKQITDILDYRRAIISETVTRGLNPDAPLKDSGVKWIGKIPAHWNCLPLKRGFTINNGKDYKDIQAEEGYPVIGSGGQFAYATDFLYSGEALLLGRKGTIDKPMYINDKFWTVDTMFYAVPNKSVCCKYMFYQAQTIPFGFYSTNTAVPSMTQTDLASNPMCFPPLAEQEAIAEYLDEKCGKIDAVVEQLQGQIADLKDLKAATISDAVTGKVDVRDWK